ETKTATLNPIAFYRGRFFPADHDLNVRIEPAKDPVAVAIQQNYEGLRFKNFTDQFEEHPGQGYLHFPTNLQYKLVLTADRPMKVVVRYGYQEKPESFKSQIVTLSPVAKGRVNARFLGQITDRVLGNDFQIKKEKADEPLQIPP